MKHKGGSLSWKAKLKRHKHHLKHKPTHEPKVSEEGHSINAGSRKGNGQTVMIVDDEELIRMTAKKALEKNGYKAITADNGVEAIRLYSGGGCPVDAVLLDDMMPEMDGEVTALKLRGINPSVKIVVMSGVEERSRYKVLMAIADFVLKKPFSTEKMLGALYRLLKSPCRRL